MRQEGGEEVLGKCVHGDALSVDDLAQTAEGTCCSRTTNVTFLHHHKHFSPEQPEGLRACGTFQQLHRLFPQGLNQPAVQLQLLKFGDNVLLITTHLKHTHTTHTSISVTTGKT